MFPGWLQGTAYVACALVLPVPRQLSPIAELLVATALMSSSVVLGGWQVPGPPAQCHAATATPTGCSLCPACSPSLAVSVAAICPAVRGWALLPGSVPRGSQQLLSAVTMKEALGCYPALCTPVALGPMETCSGTQHGALQTPACLCLLQHHAWAASSAGSERAKQNPGAKGDAQP